MNQICATKIQRVKHFWEFRLFKRKPDRCPASQVTRCRIRLPSKLHQVHSGNRDATDAVLMVIWSDDNDGHRYSHRAILLWWAYFLHNCLAIIFPSKKVHMIIIISEYGYGNQLYANHIPCLWYSHPEPLTIMVIWFPDSKAAIYAHPLAVHNICISCAVCLFPSLVHEYNWNLMGIANGHVMAIGVSACDAISNMSRVFPYVALPSDSHVIREFSIPIQRA